MRIPSGSTRGFHAKFFLQIYLETRVPQFIRNWNTIFSNVSHIYVHKYLQVWPLRRAVWTPSLLDSIIMFVHEDLADRPIQPRNTRVSYMLHVSYASCFSNWKFLADLWGKCWDTRIRRQLSTVPYVQRSHCPNCLFRAGSFLWDWNGLLILSRDIWTLSIVTSEL